MANANYPNQGIRIGELAWGVQFHLEVTEAAVEGFLDAFAPDAASADGGAVSIRAETPAAVAGLARSSGLVFERFAHLVAAHAARVDPVSLETGPPVGQELHW
jgi:hypothetical protein